MILNYFDANYVISIHEKILDLSGGTKGVKNFGNIDSPLNHIQNDDYYPTFEDKLTHLVFCLNKFHAFNDGNKRTSIAIGAFFLEVNGLEMFVDKFIIEMENIAVTVADNIIDKELLYEIIFSVINDTDYNEELKLKIVNALEKVNIDYENLNIGPEFYKEFF
ncbi:type II toxin-antitoxin system death-on-curing family toxin [Flavobacterium beibuense]|uniref:Fic superfamily toxin n=1 Tax=Flavobacterium beibuense TaxID=657326 RepID=A0A444WF68_9FLAO|nr:type II toxin-antitoxin system death-on-curing family toxin [Flavobacterium beibuense]RYJ44493.1 Fic superfamily toxin [Flavobacterium beibuense]